MNKSMMCGDADCEGLDNCPCRKGNYLRSDALMGVLPAFFVSRDDNKVRVCTHRMSAKDVPVYAKNTEDAYYLMNVMSPINNLQNDESVVK